MKCNDVKIIKAHNKLSSDVRILCEHGAREGSDVLQEWPAATGPAATGAINEGGFAGAGWSPAATAPVATAPVATAPAATAPAATALAPKSMIDLSEVPKNGQNSVCSTIYGKIGKGMREERGLLGMEEDAMLVALTIPESDKLTNLGPFFSNNGKPLLLMRSLPLGIIGSYPDFCKSLLGFVETAVEDDDKVEWRAVTFPDTMTEDQKRTLKETVDACVAQKKKQNANFMCPLYGVVAATQSESKGRCQMFWHGEYSYVRPDGKEGPMVEITPHARAYTLMPAELEDLCWGDTGLHISSINVNGALSFAGDGIQPRFDCAQGIKKTVTMICAVQLPPNTILPNQMRLAPSCQFVANGKFAEDITTVINLALKDENGYTLREVDDDLTVPIGVELKKRRKYVNKKLTKRKNPERNSSRSPAICSACCRPPSDNCNGHGHPCSAETVNLDLLQAKRQRITACMIAGRTKIDCKQKDMTHLPATYKIKSTTAPVVATAAGAAPVVAAAVVAV